MRETGWLLVLALLAAAVGCAEPEQSPQTPAASSDEAAAVAQTRWLRLGREAFELELALDPATRFHGLSDRASIAPNGGMLFVFPEPRELSFVMRDCWVPIDIAFLDISGKVLAIHEMQVEAPRRPGESPVAYEERLTRYPSGGPASFAVETAGGRLARVGLEVGQRVEIDAQSLVHLAR